MAATGLQDPITPTLQKSMNTDSSMRGKASILVVDDTRENLYLLSNMLSGQGYLVRPVSNGPRAISSARFRRPDLILLDILMPGMDGYEVCRQLKTDERTREIPVIFISALNETLDKVKAFSLGGVDYITKPFQAEEVVARVKTHLKLSELQKQLQQANAFLEQRVQERTRELSETVKAKERIVADITDITLPVVLALSEEQDFNTLLERILSAARSICHADGGTLYLREDDSLQFAIARNDSLNLNITADDDAGSALPPLQLYDEATNAPNIWYIAVASAISGQTINIPDVYAADVTPVSAFLDHTDNIPEEFREQRFDFSGIKAFDQEYRYHTTSILTVSFKNRAGEVTGILQLIKL